MGSRKCKLTFRLKKLASRSSKFELMKNSLKIWCQPISARKWTCKKKWLAKMELEISKISEFSILALYWNRKLGKLGNISNTCKSQRMCFTWGSWKFLRFLSFWFWPLYWNWKLRKLRNNYNTCKFQGMRFTWGSWKFPMFLSFRFWPIYWNQKLGKLWNFVLSEFVLFEEARNF